MGWGGAYLRGGGIGWDGVWVLGEGGQWHAIKLGDLCMYVYFLLYFSSHSKQLVDRNTKRDNNACSQ